MDANTEKPRLLQIAEHLQKHRVEFLVIGGQAAVLHGSPLPTYDIDLCYRRSPENLERLAQALRELHPSLRGAPTDLPFRLDAESLALGANTESPWLFLLSNPVDDFPGGEQCPDCN